MAIGAACKFCGARVALAGSYNTNPITEVYKCVCGRLQLAEYYGAPGDVPFSPLGTFTGGADPLVDASDGAVEA